MTHTPHPDESLPRTAVAGLLATTLLATLGTALFAFVVPLASLDARISGAWIGTAFAGYYLARLLAAPAGGLLADRIGPRALLIGAPLAGALAPLPALVLPGMDGLYAVQFLLGVLGGLHRPVVLAALGGEGRGRNKLFAAQALAFHLAVCAGPLLGGLLYLDGPGPVLTGVSACMGLAGLAAALLLPAGLRTAPAAGAEDARPAPVNPGALLLAVSGRTLGIGFLAAFYPVLLAAALGRGMRVAALFAAPALATAVGLPLAARLLRGAGDEARTLGGLLLSAGAMFCIGRADADWQFLLAGAVMGLGAAASMPASMALTAAVSPRRGRMFGTAQLAAGTGLLLGPLLGGWLVPLLGGVRAPLQLAALAGALCCAPLAASALRRSARFSPWTARLLALSLAALLAAPGLAALRTARVAPLTEPGLYRITDVAMGTVVHLTLEAGSRQGAERAAREAMEVMRLLQADFDFRSPGGSVRRINEGAGREWAEPTPRALALIKRALAISRESEGVFDPTVGALTTAEFYYALAPSLAESRRGLVDYRKLRVDEAGRVRLDLPGMALDLGGIAKGAIIDAAVGALRAQGIAGGIVEAGGDLYCFGDREWKVGIRHPRSRELYATIAVREKAVCGSGDYQQFVTVEDHGKAERLHHIIDPATMEPARASIGTTVVADSAELADALATTVFIMGPDRGREFLRRHHPEAAAVWFDPDRSVARTDNFPR